MIFESWLQELTHYNLASLFILFLIENLILILLSVVLAKIIEFDNTRLHKTDRKWIISTLICNTFITLLGFELYRYNIIKIDFSPPIFFCNNRYFIADCSNGFFYVLFPLSGALLKVVLSHSQASSYACRNERL